VTIAGISYYSMATGLGVSDEQRAHTHTYRQLFYARYIGALSDRYAGVVLLLIAMQMRHTASPAFQPGHAVT